MVQVELSDETVSRLKLLAEPLVDTYDTVIMKLLESYAPGVPSIGSSSTGELRVFNPLHIPDLKHTKVIDVTIDGDPSFSDSSTWNGILNRAIKLAAKRTPDYERLRSLVLINMLPGKKVDEGYRHLSDVDLSVQGQDSNSAWKASYHIFQSLGVGGKVVFTWRNKTDAAHPGVTGRFIWKGK